VRIALLIRLAEGAALTDEAHRRDPFARPRWVLAPPRPCGPRRRRRPSRTRSNKLVEPAVSRCRARETGPQREALANRGDRRDRGASSSRRGPVSVARLDDVPHDGIDLGVPPATAEDAIVAHSRLQVVTLAQRRMPVHRSCAAGSVRPSRCRRASPSTVSSDIRRMVAGSTRWPWYSSTRGELMLLEHADARSRGRTRQPCRAVKYSS
jgi:hypothetical protein